MNPYLPREAEIVSRHEESATTFSLGLRLTDGQPYRFAPGQFNMLYLYGCGEVPISIVGDDPVAGTLSHTIRAVGRVTQGLQQLAVGDRIGLRGPYGRGWPMAAAETARPRWATNHLPMAVRAMWVIMPCPNSRSP